jgi:hypothetical protein
MPIIEIQIPYTSGLGKNKKVGFAKGHYYTKKEYRDACKSLSDIVWGKSRGQKWLKDKIWVEIFLQKERNNSDVCNFVDGIADAIKTGLGVDDQWYSFKLDWEYEKGVSPYILITIIQN